MARIRTVKPEHWSDKNLATISLQAHLLWVGTWNFSDDAGVFENDPLLIKSQVFPRRKDVRTEQIVTWLEQLVKARYIVPFEYNGSGYYKTRTFQAHQKIDRATPSKIPAEILQKLDDQSTSPRRTLSPVEESSVEESSSSVEESRGYTPSPEMELNDLDINKSIEYLTITKKITATRELVLSIWIMFKTKNFGGKKYYKDEADVRSHFFNSLKYENIKQEHGKVTKGNFNGKPVPTGDISKRSFGKL